MLRHKGSQTNLQDKIEVPKKMLRLVILKNNPLANTSYHGENELGRLSEVSLETNTHVGW